MRIILEPNLKSRMLTIFFLEKLFLKFDCYFLYVEKLMVNLLFLHFCTEKITFYTEFLTQKVNLYTFLLFSFTCDKKRLQINYSAYSCQSFSVKNSCLHVLL